MKKFAFIFLGLMIVFAISCQNSSNGGNDTSKKDNQPTEASVKQAVEQLMQLDVEKDVDKILTADMLSLQNQTLGVHFEGTVFLGFQWDTGVLDVCSENNEIKIEGVKLVDSLHSDVAMRYVDEGCYDEPYTLHLLKENGQWKIDDVDFQEGTLRDQCKLFYEEVAEWFRTESPDAILDFFMTEEPSEENYTNPNAIYCNNPQAVRTLVSEIRNNHELFKKNQGYTNEMGQKIDAMIDRIESHIK